MTQERPEHIVENERFWNAYAPEWVERGQESWAADEPFWGIWRLPESQVHMLPADLDGADAIELGCGTGYGSHWMARRGARVLGVDLSTEQLATARRLAAEHGEDRVTFLHANAERVPRPDASFDMALSEYGAAIWCDPHVWLREAWRLLRPGGRLVFLGAHPLASVCTPADGSPTDRTLHRSWFDLRRLDWRDVEEDPGGIEFNLPIAGWLRLFRELGFEVEDYLELRAPDGDPDTQFSMTRRWARDHPSEQVWKLRKPG